MSNPLVSVVIPTHNRAKLLPRAIDSVIAQTFSDWELLVIDDASTDETPQVIEKFAPRLGDRLVYRRQPQTGAPAARNAGIEAATGRFVAFLDSDDEFLPTKLARQMRLFMLRPDLGLVYSDWSTVEIDGRMEESVFRGRHSSARDVPTEPIAPGLYVCQDLFDALLRNYFICTIVGLVRRDVLGDRTRFRSDLRFGEEWLFYLEIARACRAGFVDEPLSIYHFQPGSLSRSDKHRNAVEFHRLLKAMRTTFPDLNTSRRRIVNRNIAELNRQLGCIAYREARFDAAVARFAEALRCAPTLRTVCHLGQSLWRRRRNQRRRSDSDFARDQVAPPAVR